MVHNLLHFIFHNFSSEGDTQETQTYKFCSKEAPGATELGLVSNTVSST